MYMHRIENAAAKVNDLLAAADYFQMDGLKEMCGRHLLDTITPENCLEVSLRLKGTVIRQILVSFPLL
jgi:hypothetical protein